MYVIQVQQYSYYVSCFFPSSFFQFAYLLKEEDIIISTKHYYYDYETLPENDNFVIVCLCNNDILEKVKSFFFFVIIVCACLCVCVCFTHPDDDDEIFQFLHKQKILYYGHIIVFLLDV